MLSLSTKIEQLKKVGPFYLKRLAQLKIKTIRDLFFHFPHRYDDFSQIIPISQLKEGQKATIRGEIAEIKNTRLFHKRMVLTEGLIKDNSGTIKAVWFNHHETAGLSSRYLRYLIKPLLPLTAQTTDFLPETIKKKFKLMDLAQAIRQIHFPDNSRLAEAARYRLGFDELFLIHLTTLKQKQKLNQEKAPIIPFEPNLIKSFVKSLPFKLTDDQRKAAWQIFQDIAKDRPMNRLLDGDVGSGKTILAIMAGLSVAKSGYQVALMAPTEILAKQHFETFKNFLEKEKIKIGLLTSSNKLKIDKRIDIIIGTHALIQKNVKFDNLALAIVDEQHRFGVAQRAALQEKTIPHLLSMTATPIPRTLALTIYGDLDISLLKEMPKGRQKIITKIVAPTDRQKTYNFIKKQVKQKKQVFVICPLIDESDKLSVKSVSQEYKKLSEKVFPKLKIAMLHSKLKPKEKEEIMKKFKEGKTDILVSTSVVEVGIDVPTATVMMIEGADRFGLAQLHQFRGRIGRGSVQSYCFLFADSTAKKTRQRLKAVLTAKNGFELAEKDLKIRGPGDFSGVRQWGLPDLAMASLNNLELIQKSRQAAQKVLENNLFNPALKEKLKQFQKVIHLE